MVPFLYRYNRFSKSYLINYRGYEFEAEPELFTILQTYFHTNDLSKTVSLLVPEHIIITEQEINDILTLIDHSASTHENKLLSKTYKVMQFNHFNSILDHTGLMWLLTVASIFFVLYSLPLIAKYFVLPKAASYTFFNIMLIIPIYYLSRFLFTPIHEFGHYFFYYLFTKQSAIFYIQIPGFLYFGGITTTDYLFYIPNTFKRMIISLAGVLTEIVFLALILQLCQFYINPFILQILTVRVFLSVVFNMNVLSQSTDGHVLITDLLGFTTFTETYNDYLRHLLNKQFIPAVYLHNRVKLACILYTILGLLFIGLLVYTQIQFLQHIILLLLLPLFSFTFTLSFLDVVCLIITYAYYIDLLVRIYAKRIILQKGRKIMKNEF